MSPPGPGERIAPFDALLIRLFAVALRMTPTGLEPRWRARAVADFEARLEGLGGPGLLPRLTLTAGALFDLAKETVRRRLAPPSGAQGRARSFSTRGMTPMDVVWQDVRYAIRGIRRSPGVATVVVVTLALAIGVTSTLFSVVNGPAESPSVPTL